MAATSYPAFSELDRDLIHDFYGSFQEALEEIGHCRDALAISQDDKELLHRLFRAVHSLKGNCNMMFLPAFVAVTHKLEEIFDDVRKERFPYEQAYCAFALAALSDIDEQLRALIQHQSFDAEVLDKVGKLVSAIRDCADDGLRRDTAVAATTAILDRHYDLALIGQFTAPVRMTPSAGPVSAEQLFHDLEFMADIASAMDVRRAQWRGRMARQLELVKLLNRELGVVVDDTQLSAAVFFHDIGMSWLASNLLTPWQQLSDDDKRLASRHVDWSAGLLRRWPGWQEAALMIEHHHEHHDGSGLPRGLKHEAITTGASLLALADVFFDATTSRNDLGYKQSLLGAVKDINALSGRQFPADVVDKFNAVIRAHYLAQPRW